MPYTLRDGSITRTGRALVIVACAVACTWIPVGLVWKASNWAVILPLVTEIAVATTFWLVLWRRDGVLPLFDVGAICMIATLAYSAVPLIGYAISGFEFGILSDNRLFAYDPSDAEVGEFAWRHVLYMLGLAAGYLSIRRGGVHLGQGMTSPPMSMLMVLVLFLTCLTLFEIALWGTTGFSFSASYADLRSGGVQFEDLPLGVRQIAHNTRGIAFVLKLGLLIVLFLHYRSRTWRVVLWTWLLGETVFAIVNLGARSEMVLLLLATVLLYHQLVRRLTLISVASLGSLFLALFFGIGLLRDYAADGVALDSLLTASNEFQAVFGTAYDVYRIKAAGVEFPWQLYVADLLRLVPQQVLPFEKIDPSVWYLRQIGLEDTGVGFMFGAIAEGVIAFDWFSIAAQALIVGFLFGCVHNWYAARSDRFLPTLVYIWVCVEAYYTFRASTFYLLVWILYRLFPAVAILWGGSLIFRYACVQSRGEGSMRGVS